MHGRHEDGLATELELAHDRLARVVEGRVGRVDPAGADAQRWPPLLLRDDLRVRRRARGAGIDEGQVAVEAVEQDVADVAAGLAAVRLVLRVDPLAGVCRSAGSLDGRNELRHRLISRDGAVVGGTAVVLDLLDREDVRAAQVVHDLAGEAGELLVGILRCKVLDVEGGHGQLAVVRLGDGRLARQTARRVRRHGRQFDLEVGEAVVHDAGAQTRKGVSHTGFRHLVSTDDQVVELQAHGVRPVVAAVDDAVELAADRLDFAAGYHGDLAERGRRTDNLRVADTDVHPLKGLVEVDGVGSGRKATPSYSTLPTCSASIVCCGATRSSPMTTGAGKALPLETARRSRSCRGRRSCRRRHPPRR